jgi:hypothetical protein|tara:strand:- start:1394 stop:1585 length:192 start_codon:yes stop_codon:yes gene_type:complete
MPERSAYDKERIAHINFLMDQINDSTTEIYESLVDREFSKVKLQVQTLIIILKDINTSIEDDV